MRFSTLFGFAVFLTVISLIAAVTLTLVSTDKAAAAPVVESCTTTWKLGFGAILGLLGGRMSRSGESGNTTPPE